MIIFIPYTDTMYWTITICGKQFVNGQPINEVDQLRQLAKTCSIAELNAFIKDCEASEDFEKCAILFEELQNKLNEQKQRNQTNQMG